MTTMVWEMKDLDRTMEQLKAMSKESRKSLMNFCSHILDMQDMDNWDRTYGCYKKLCAIEDEEYRAENMDAFKAYEARMNEPDFDWGYYSDWHKDMFGYRPHFKAIPISEEERQHMCETWHQARGL